MSGIVNSAGSKSGVIGTTELDYEEGTWTPASGVGTASAVYGIYTKIGRLVHCTGSITFPSQTSGSSVGVYGLPYTQYTGTPPATGSCGYTQYHEDGLLLSGINQAVHFVIFKRDEGTTVTNLTYTNISAERVDFDFTYYMS